ncbi:MAG: hypothetical protein PVS2B2_03650 [Candidatus Acidiferrum sp.]
MSVLHFRYKERRRTLRVSLTVPLVVHGEIEGGGKFCVRTTTQAVNKNGALLCLQEPVVMGQSLLLVNETSNRTTEGRVVYIKHDRDGKTYVGVEFSSTDSNFWHMTFPVPGARPLRRALREKVTA